MDPYIEMFVEHASYWLSPLWRASWQGGLVLLLVWLVVRAWPRMASRTQIWLWRLAFLKMLLALCWAGAVTLVLLPAPRQATTAAFSQKTPAPPAVQLLPNAPPAPPSAALLPPAAPPMAVTRTAGRPVTAVLQQAMDALIPFIPYLLALTMLLWLYGASFRLIRLLRAWWQTARLVRACRPMADAPLQALVDDLSRRLGLFWTPEVRLSDGLGPMLVSALQPTIILPTALVEAGDRTALRMMLAHELAHIRQQDLRWGWLAQLLEMLFFFHPLVHLGVREWQLAQEMQCDRLALTTAEVEEAAYGSMLVDAAAFVARQPQPELLAAGISESFSQLKRRLYALGQRATSRTVLRPAAVLLGALLFASLIPWRLAAQQASIAVTVLPYVDNICYTLTPVQMVDEIYEPQRQLNDLLVADHAFDGSGVRAIVQEGTVTITFPAGKSSPSNAQQRSIDRAIMQVFKEHRPRAKGITIHPVSAALRDQVIAVLEKRLASAGMSEVKVHPHGTAGLLLIPTTDTDLAQLHALLTPDRLEFLLLPKNMSVTDNRPNGPIQLSVDGNTLTDTEAIVRSYLVLDGSTIGSANDSTDPQTGHRNVITISLANQQACARFAEITGNNIGRNMAIVDNGFIICAPFIQSRIKEGRMLIDGHFSEAEAQRLVAEFNGGELPAPIKVVE